MAVGNERHESLVIDAFQMIPKDGQTIARAVWEQLEKLSYSEKLLSKVKFLGSDTARNQITGIGIRTHGCSDK